VLCSAATKDTAERVLSNKEIKKKTTPLLMHERLHLRDNIEKPENEIAAKLIIVIFTLKQHGAKAGQTQ
jgi:predicted nucleic acid binding AN1-type Zn finger protein